MTNAELITKDDPIPTAHGGPEAPPTAAVTLSQNLRQRLIAVKQALGHIGKTAQAPPEMGGFMYTPWEAVSDKLGDLLASHGIVLWPSLVSSEQVTAGTTSKGKTIYRTRIRLDLTFENADDPTDNRSILWEGEGDDTSDKSTQKAATSAEKYALMKLFLLGTMEAVSTDSDAGSPQAATGRAKAATTSQRADSDGAVPEIPGTDRPFRERDLCPACALDGNKTTRGGRPAFFIPKQGPHAGVLQCNGRAEGGQGAWLNHIPAISPQEAATADDNPANEAEIPV